MITIIVLLSFTIKNYCSEQIKYSTTASSAMSSRSSFDHISNEEINELFLSSITTTIINENELDGWIELETEQRKKDKYHTPPNSKTTTPTQSSPIQETKKEIQANSEFVFEQNSRSSLILFKISPFLIKRKSIIHWQRNLSYCHTSLTPSDIPHYQEKNEEKIEEID